MIERKSLVEEMRETVHERKLSTVYVIFIVFIENSCVVVFVEADAMQYGLAWIVYFFFIC